MRPDDRCGSFTSFPPCRRVRFPATCARHEWRSAEHEKSKRELHQGNEGSINSVDVSATPKSRACRSYGQRPRMPARREDTQTPTPRHREIIALVVQGFSIREIAQRLG